MAPRSSDCGANWIFVLLAGVGWLGIAHFYMPARADLGLDATNVWFSETHYWGVIIGCTRQQPIQRGQLLALGNHWNRLGDYRTSMAASPAGRSNA